MEYRTTDEKHKKALAFMDSINGPASPRYVDKGAESHITWCGVLHPSFTDPDYIEPPETFDLEEMCIWIRENKADILHTPEGWYLRLPETRTAFYEDWFDMMNAAMRGEWV